MHLLVIWLCFLLGPVCLLGQETDLLAGELQPQLYRFTPQNYGGNRQVWDITQADNGTLYIANADGVLSYDGVRWRKLLLPGRPIVRSVLYHDGKLFAGGYGQLGYFTNLSAAEPLYVDLSAQLPAGERGEEIWHIEALNDGTVVYHSFARLYHFQKDKLQDNLAPGILLFALNEGDRLILPVDRQGLYTYVPGSPLRLMTGSEALASRNVMNLVRWKEGYLVATEDTVFLFNEGTLQPTTLPPLTNRLLRLRDGGLAVGTIGEGVYVYDSELKLQQHLDRDQGLGNNTVLALHEDLAGNLWVGLDLGLTLVNYRGSLTFADAATAEKGTVYTALKTEEAVYLGTNQGLYRKRRVEGGQFRLVPGVSGQVWALDTVSGRIVCAHNDGSFVIGPDGGKRIQESTGAWETVAHPTYAGIYVQPTYAGLAILRDAPKGLTIERIPGLNAPLRSIAWLDDHSLIAAHAARGIYRLHLTEDFSAYRSIDTLQPSELNKPSVVVFGDTIMVQSMEGVFQYADDSLRARHEFRGVNIPPGALIAAGHAKMGEWFIVSPGRVQGYRYENPRSTLAVHLATDYPLIVPWDQERYLLGLNEGFAMHIVTEEVQNTAEMLLYGTSLDRDAMRFQGALPVFDREVRYRYRLLGRSPRWSEWSNRAEVELRGLWEGDYVLEMEADWYNASARKAFTIAPPWYRSPLAYLLYVLVGGSLIVIFYRLHRTRLRVQERRLELVRRRQLQQQEIQARNRELEEKITAKNRELANSTLTLARKNEMLLQLRDELEKGRTDKVHHLIQRNLNNEEDWALFETHFNEVHDAFLRRLRQQHPDLTPGDLQLAAYLKMNLSSKEIAPLLHISLRGVENKRYRLRKKLELGAEQRLNGYLHDL